MSSSSEEPWSDKPYAPQIPYLLYFAEKANFAGMFVSSVLYGVSARTGTYPNLPRLSIHRFRDRRCPVLPVHDRAAQFHLSQKERSQMGTRGLCYDLVFVRDHKHHDW